MNAATIARVQVICPACRQRIPVHPDGALMVHRGHGHGPCLTRSTTQTEAV